MVGSKVNIPNLLTTLRLILVPFIFGFLLAFPHDGTWRTVTMILFMIAVFTDYLDGQIARRNNLVTDFGKLWDPVADKFMTGMAFIGLSILSELWWWVTVVVMVREIGITLLREWLRKRQIIMPANRGGKLKTMMQSLALTMFIFGLWRTPTWFDWIAYIAMGIAVALTIVSGVIYLIETRRNFRQR